MQQKEMQDIQRISSFDYFADDEDPSAPKTPLNALLSQPYMLEAFSFGSLALFFFINNLVLGGK